MGYRCSFLVSIFSLLLLTPALSQVNEAQQIQAEAAQVSNPLDLLKQFKTAMESLSTIIKKGKDIVTFSPAQANTQLQQCSKIQPI